MIRMSMRHTGAPKGQEANRPVTEIVLGKSAPKGQKANSPGQRPGVRDGYRHTPCKGKSLGVHIMLLPLQGATTHRLFTQGGALGWKQVAPSGRMNAEGCNNGEWIMENGK